MRTSRTRRHLKPASHAILTLGKVAKRGYISSALALGSIQCGFATWENMSNRGFSISVKLKTPGAAAA